MSKKIKVSIIGATGYTGIELLKILVNHPNVEIKYLISATHENIKINDLYPHLDKICELKLANLDPSKVAKESDTTFLSLPHLESQKIIPEMIGLTKIIDLGGDFRLKNPKQFEKYYGHKHLAPEILSKFSYGLPEINKIKGPNIANPGCFATVCQLALFPLKNLVGNVEIVAITGSSGSGKMPSEQTHHPIRNHNIKSYKINTHQHIPEILQSLNLSEENLSLVPTSGPFTRGIHITAFVELKKAIEAKKMYQKIYQKSFFIRIKENIELAQVIGSNFCDISVQENGKKIILQAAIDNMLKGAAGTAIQNFNIIHNLDEKIGLQHLTPLYP